MFKKSLIFLICLLSFFVIKTEAKKRVKIKISCTIPPLVRLNLDSKKFFEKKDGSSTIIQIEERVRGKEKVIIKTVLVK